MLSRSTQMGRSEPSEPQIRIGFVGEPGVGKTTVAALVGKRLAARTAVRVEGTAASLVGVEPGSRTGEANAESGLGYEWVVRDAPAGIEAFEERVERLDVAFVVVEPSDLETAEAYERVAQANSCRCFVVVNKFEESSRDRLQSFLENGPELAEYFYEDEDIRSAVDDGTTPTLDDWTVEAILIEALQPERLDGASARQALENGRRDRVNVEVETADDGARLVDAFRTDGFPATYLACNCRCHDGHVLARRVDQAATDVNNTLDHEELKQ